MDGLTIICVDNLPNFFLTQKDLYNMLGQSSFSRGAGTTASDRIFVYEVTRLKQNAATTQCDYQIRQGGNTLLQVPLNRMNEAMQRVVNSGGKIVSIRPLSPHGEEHSSPAPEKNKKSKN
jgi:sulfite reductase alpha subunit-like flavoprotein